MNHLFKKFKSDILGLWWLAIGLFIALALISYHTSDPSFNSTGSGHQVINYCGYFGSFLSDLLYQFLGISAWLVVALAFRRSLLCFWRKEEAIGKRTRWIWSGLFFITSASLIGLYFPETSVFSQQVSAAGLVGMMVSRGLVKIFNFAGVAVILWTAAAIFLVFYTERTIKELLKSLWNLMRGAFSPLMEIWFKMIHLLPRLGSSGSDRMSFTEPRPILSEPEAKSTLPLTALKASRNLTFLLRREKKNLIRLLRRRVL